LTTKRKRNNKDELSYTKLIIAGLLVMFLAYATVNRLNSQLTDVSITIAESDSDKYLITKKQVRAKLKSMLGYDISLANIGQLDIYKIENLLNADERINKSDIYIDKNNKLHVQVEQRKPIVRIQVTNGEDYYLDYEGGRIPVTETIRVPVVTGRVDAYISNYSKQKNNNINGVLDIAKRIHDSDFLTVLVEQIDINAEDEVTLVPKLGKSRILLGQPIGLDKKFEKLAGYYKSIKKVGINKFDEIDLKWGDDLIYGRDTKS